MSMLSIPDLNYHSYPCYWCLLHYSVCYSVDSDVFHIYVLDLYLLIQRKQSTKMYEIELYFNANVILFNAMV